MQSHKIEFKIKKESSSFIHQEYLFDIERGLQKGKRKERIVNFMKYFFCSSYYLSAL